MVRLNRIYTRTGDEGTTGLVDGSRLPKHAPRMEAVGAVDEANAALGFALRKLSGKPAGVLRHVQNDLFDLGADIATPGDDFTPSDTALRIVAAQVAWLERRIDAFNKELEPLTSFVLPGGNEAASRLHLARTAVRRAERASVALAEAEAVNPAALAYLNRLSDLIFVMARAANDGGKGDILWQPGANR